MKKNDPKNTPLMRQYFDIKNRHPDKYLFFRLGDFYEMFDQDALEVSTLLQITLTERHGIPMCGIPYHQLHRYAHKVISQGRKIVIVEQEEKPASGTGILTRRIAQIITPGTTIDEMNLNAGEKNFLVSFYFPKEERLFFDQTHAGIIALETTTGEVIFETAEDVQELYQSLRRFFENYKPTELVLPESYRGIDPVENLTKDYLQIIINFWPDPEPDQVNKKIASVYREQGSKIPQINDQESSLYTGLYLLLAYTEENYGVDLSYLKSPKWVAPEGNLILGQDTLIHLEIFKNNYDHTRKHSLLSVVDHTRTPMGARKIQESLALPSRNLTVIRNRLEQTDFFFREPLYLKEITSWLHHIADLERISSRLSLGRILPRDLLSLKRSLNLAGKLIASLAQKQPGWIKEISFTPAPSPEEDNINSLLKQIEKIAVKIDNNISDEPNNDLNKGDNIKPSAHPQLEEYHRIKTQGENLLSDLEMREKNKSGVAGLRIRYNDMLGYFFEAGKSNAAKLPDYFIRKQVLVSSERFVTEELLTLDSKIRESRENSVNLEREIFEKLRQELTNYIPLFQKISEFIAHIDMICGFADLAATRRWSKPVITEDGVLRIKGGRHPVVEADLPDPFIPNDITIGTEEDRVQIITGPNMSGKSTFLRQNALIVILAHLGCFVPAASAEVPLCDQVFTRIGSGDRLFQGESTFLAEMKETARILNQMTPQSLVVMDEIGRGTSTYDGLALAWSILEYINHRPEKRSKTLFATHYHELISLTKEEGITHYHVTIREEGDQIIFLKKVVPGVTSRSYGIQVARLAGIPEEVVSHAQDLLGELEKKQELVNPDEVNQRLKDEKSEQVKKETDNREPPWVEEILNFDVTTHSPLETAQFLSELQKQIRNDRNHPST